MNSFVFVKCREIPGRKGHKELYFPRAFAVGRLLMQMLQ